MEDLKIFIKNVRDFYRHFEKEACTFEELLKKSAAPCNIINNQSSILNSIIAKEALEGTGLEYLSKLQDLLADYVLDVLKRQFDILLDIRKDAFELVNGLYEKHTAVEQSFHKLQNSNFDYLTVLNPAAPRLEYVVDWALDVWRYYHSLYLQISTSVENLSFENSDSVTTLVECFKENEKLKEEVNIIRRLELQYFPFIE